MTTVSVVATVEASNEPPRVRLDVTDTGSPNLFEATVTRLDPDGIVRPVRTYDGNPLVLSTVGSVRTGLLYDYEMPYGAPVTYSTLETPGASSSSATVDQNAAWLVHPGVPALSMPIEFRVNSFDSEEWPVQEGVLYPMGRKFSVVRTDGVRKGAESSFTVAVSSLTELESLKALLSDAGTVQLNVPTTMSLGIDTCYIAVGNVSNARPSDIGTAQQRDVTLPYRVVDQPVGGSQSQRTYADVLAENASYASIRLKYSTYLAVLAGP